MADRPIYCIFVAGGSGSRMAAALAKESDGVAVPALPKQFLDLEGMPVLQRTIERFVEALPGAKIITVLPREHVPTWRRMCIENDFNCSQMLVAGGMTRFHSVRNALAKVPDGAIVSIHDGVRPLISAKLIRNMAERMATERALIPVTKVVDTLRWSEPVGGPAPDRSRMLAVQTPQMFLSEDLKAAYCQAYDISFTDDASVAERAGIKVSVIEGEKTNIKLTTPEDLVLARAILEAYKA